MSTHPLDRGATAARRQRLLSWALLVGTVCALTAGVIAWLLGAAELAGMCWAAGTLSAVIPALWWVGKALAHRRVGVDIVAVLSLLGALAVGEYLAGALIAVMLATGRTLEAAAQRRAAKDLRLLLTRAPKTARRCNADGVSTIPLEELLAGDRVVVGPGEVIPVDGLLLSESATLDESALTGEAVPADRGRGATIRSGAVNAGRAVEIRATGTAAESTYAGIVRLAEQAAAESAPVVRLADRAAAWFVPLALGVAGVAWLASGSARRAVAVLVVATPCPLLLAAPVAIVAGLSRASRFGVVVRGGAALETLGRVTTLVLDKTGTVTSGRPRGTDVAVAPGWTARQVLRLAASAEQFSPHVLARAIVADAVARRLNLSVPTDVDEAAGTGVSATVDGRRVTVGNRACPTEAGGWAAAAASRAALDGAVLVWVTVDGEPVGVVSLLDPLRADAPRTLRRLRAAGITRLVMLTGDRPEPAAQIGTILGMDEVRALQSPADKVAGVRAERRHAVTAMVGDGVNDAPALAAATVGVALAGHGSTASSEAADVVLMSDRLDRLADAMEIARRSQRIAVQSAVTGMGLSLVAMVCAAVGWLPPAPGALLQEGIDVAVIANALRALRSPRETVRISRPTEQLIRRFAAEHDDLRDDLAELRDAARLLVTGDPAEALTALRGADRFVQQTLLPHEHAEERNLYPALARPLGSAEATAAMSRMHAEIDRLARRIHAHVETAHAAGAVRADQLDDLLASLYGLHALLALHFATEEENYFTLAAGGADGEPGRRTEWPGAERLKLWGHSALSPEAPKT